MNAITKERIELFIKNPLENGLTRGEQMELARIALVSLDEEPVAWMCDDEDGREYNGHNEFSNGRRGIPLYATPPALVVPHEWRLSNAQAFIERYSPPSVEEAALFAWNACRAAMFQSQREGNPHVTPARLPGGFTIEDAKELHEDLVRSHISQALSGEKMKKKDRDADLRWIHGVIVQAAWFVKASLDALPEPLREEKEGSANCTASHGTTDNPPVPGKQTDELTMLVKQLVSQLKKVKPDCKLPGKAMEYLKRNGLISAEDILR